VSPDLPPDLSTPPEPPGEPAPPEPPRPESYPFWSYWDLAAFLVIAFLALVVDVLAASAIAKFVHLKPLPVELVAQFIFYGFVLWVLALIFRRYYDQPFWRSLRWVPAGVSPAVLVSYGTLVAFGVMVGGVLLRTPDTNSPMKQLLSDPASVVLLAIFGTTLAPLCEELLFRGFLQPLLVRSFGAAEGILLTALPFGLLHLQEYGNSWRHGLLITLAGAAFGWVRHRTGSTKAAVVMHATYNAVFFLLLAAQKLAVR
jgi:CAAX protease family protein